MLSRIQKAMNKNEEGFTLIELLVVIIIIGILAAIAIPTFLNQRAKATESGMKSDLRSVANEMESSYTDLQVYPAVSHTVGGLASVGTGTAAVTVKISDNLTTVSAPVTGGQAFCLKADNSKISKQWYYNSASGGITTTPCVAP